MGIAFGNFLIAFAAILGSVISFLMIIVFLYVVISWVNADPYNPVVRFITASVEPFLRPLRKISRFGGAVDFSPMVLLLLLVFGRYFIVQSLHDYGVMMKPPCLMSF